MNWKIIFKSFKNRDMQKRVLILFLIFAAYRLMAHIPVPLAEPTQLKEVVNSLIGNTDLGGFLNLLSGGALTSFSIILVGMSPFITASIITQLLTKAIPKLEELHKDGESGRRKINQWTRLVTLPLAVLQSIAFIYILRQTVLANNTTVLTDASIINWIVAVIAMTAGSMILMWFGELITEQGIGNGISLVIFAGIISQLPITLASIGKSLFDTSSGSLDVFGWFSIPVNPSYFWVAIALASASLAILYILVKINEAQRIITINYAKRVQGNSIYGGIKSILPVKLIAANVIPIIFAVAFLSLPAFVGQIIKATGNESYLPLAENLIKWFQSPTGSQLSSSNLEAFIYPLLYFILVIAFTYFYTGIIFNSNEIAENLQKQGGFVEGVRPGKQTEEYLNKVVNRLTLYGALALGSIAILPFLAEYLLYNFAGISDSNISMGGTGLLIVVSVALESLRQINSRALMVTYDDYK
ncbi:MAG TPA: preprotein translocase subunit SecY [Candidatus Saccharibacteria bacterium]|nr:preprotein translocase subunit SecY [Candidatus Saccharibacteria bacterium]